MLQKTSEQHISTAHWKRAFEDRKDAHRHIAVTSLGSTTNPRLPPDLEEGLRRSLPTFQLGEEGSGAHLRRAAMTTRDRDYLRAIELFVREEQEHARLLALVLNAMDEPLQQRSWLDAVFVKTRHFRDLRIQVLTLLVPELIALAYYRVLRDSPAPVSLTNLFAKIHDDEQFHVQFHRSTLPHHIRRWHPAIRRVVRLGWRAAVIGGALAVAVAHRKVLRAAGVRLRDFHSEVRANLHTTDRALFGYAV